MTPEQTKRFKYWQTRTIIATMVGYALFYFVRKNFSLAMPGLEADLGISKTSVGDSSPRVRWDGASRKRTS